MKWFDYVSVLTIFWSALALSKQSNTNLFHYPVWVYILMLGFSCFSFGISTGQLLERNKNQH